MTPLRFDEKFSLLYSEYTVINMMNSKLDEQQNNELRVILNIPEELEVGKLYAIDFTQLIDLYKDKGITLDRMYHKYDGMVMMYLGPEEKPANEEVPEYKFLFKEQVTKLKKREAEVWVRRVLNSEMEEEDEVHEWEDNTGKLTE